VLAELAGAVRAIHALTTFSLGELGGAALDLIVLRLGAIGCAMPRLELGELVSDEPRPGYRGR
jgi:hypothetical protein